MDPFLHFLLTAALVGVLGFVASLLVRYRQGLFGSVGAGYLGMGIGSWLAGLLHFSDPLTVEGVPVLLTFAGALLILLIVRLIRQRR